MNRFDLLGDTGYDELHGLNEREDGRNAIRELLDLVIDAGTDVSTGQELRAPARIRSSAAKSPP
jgi:hypothetical protein